MRKLREVVSWERNEKTDAQYLLIHKNLKPIRNSQWLFHSPFLSSKRNSAVLTIKHGAEKLVLDFRK